MLTDSFFILIFLLILFIRYFVRFGEAFGVVIYLVGGGFLVFSRGFFVLFGRFLGRCCSSAVLRVFIFWVSFWGSEWVELE